ncbi:MAG: FeoB-associated Cys-rich membrane protein [Pyrinomonadaceae bacterium]
MSIQTITVMIIVLGAVLYGIRALVRKKRAFKPGCGNDCGCH